MKTFITITDNTICNLINSAKWRVIYASPGVSKDVADSIIAFALRNGLGQVEVVLDPNPEVCRLGYGVIEAVEKLYNSGIKVRKSSGLRIGVLVADNEAFVFSPTPLLVEALPKTSVPNAIAVETEQANKLVSSICPLQLELMNDDEYIKIEIDKTHIEAHTPEVGKDEMTKEELDTAIENLENAPPLQFDLERQVRVYSSFVQFVELKLIGCNIERHTISIPSKLVNLIKDEKEKERFKASYRLISENSKISGKEIEEKVKKLRKKYVRSMGSRYGNVILRQKKKEFELEVEKIKEEINNFRDAAVKKLNDEFEKSKKILTKALLPEVRKNPPDDLIGVIIGNKPTTEEFKRYIEVNLNSNIPKAETFVSKMELYCDYKDVTYEMLNDDSFFANLIEAFPYIDWPDRPYEEFSAAREAEVGKG